jgi:hypothetical protein
MTDIASDEDPAMLRVRLKADGRIVEILPDGSERPIEHADPARFVREVRARCSSSLTRRRTSPSRH